jgi:uncharacterized protein YdeI (BOF family)
MEGLHHKREGVRRGVAATGVLVAVFVISLVFSPSYEGEIKRGWIRVVNAAPSSVVINEVMWAGSTVSTSDEWIELYNPTAAEIDMSGWTLEHAAGSSSPGLTLPSGALISAGGYYIVGNFDKDHVSSAFKVDVDYVTTSISLLNTNNGDVVLKNADGAVVDQAAGNSWPAGESSSATKKSMERGVDLLDGLLTTSWHTSTNSLDQKNFGTPRAANSTPPVNVAPIAAISGPAAGSVGQILSWSAEDSTDADGDSLSYSWSFGDGTSGTGAAVTHAYAAAGSFVVLVTVSDGEIEAEASKTITVTAPVYSSAVVINELLPNPVGSDTTTEFIEVRNTGDAAVDLGGWQLDDAEGGSAPYTIPSGTTLSGGSIKSFSRSDTKLALNNTGDSARLLDPAGVVKSSYTYSSSVPEGQSYNRTSNGAYVISTTLTPGAANVITAPVEEEEEDDPPSPEASEGQAKKGTIAGATAKKVALENIREEEEGTTVTVDGVVSVPPGIMGEREIYLAGSGIQLYYQKGAWPNLKLGDRIAVTGVLGSNRGEARLKIAAASDVKRQAAGEPPAPHVIKTGDIGEDYEGWLVTVQGHVTETNGDTFYVDDDSGEVKIFIKESTKIDKPKMKVDDAVTITGIVSETTSGYRILPRFQEDVRHGLVAGLTSFPATGESYSPSVNKFLFAIILISHVISALQALSSPF